MGAILMDTATELNKPLIQPKKQYAKEGLSGWLTRLHDLANCQKHNATTEVKGIPDSIGRAFILSIMICRNCVLHVIKIGKTIH